jgi:hypothetical protein
MHWKDIAEHARAIVPLQTSGACDCVISHTTRCSFAREGARQPTCGAIDSPFAMIKLT